MRERDNSVDQRGLKRFSLELTIIGSVVGLILSFMMLIQPMMKSVAKETATEVARQVVSETVANSIYTHDHNIDAHVTMQNQRNARFDKLETKLDDISDQLGAIDQQLMRNRTKKGSAP